MSIRRIARLAGISPSAVSLALQDSPKVSAGTKRRVAALAKQISYRRNGKLTELMSHVRAGSHGGRQTCFGVISFYDEAKPWEKSVHLSRIYDGMLKRAEALGYRLEPLWLRAPGMTYRRFRSILDARGIEGLISFGSPNLAEEMPAEFDHYAIVTQGLSIKTPLHRVVSHVFNDTWRMLNRLQELGYRRPGLVIGRYEEERSAHAYVCAYLGWCQLIRSHEPAIPVLHLDSVEEQPILSWLERYTPDALVFVHHYNMLPAFDAMLRAHGIRAPRDLGVAVISQILDGTEFSGLEENQHLIGAWCIELLVSRIMNRDVGIPEHPRIEMVERRWINGKSLRAPRR